MTIIIEAKTIDNLEHQFPLITKCKVGRSSSCDFIIDDPKMSGAHGQFELKENGQVFFKDLSSSNGSYMDNALITEVRFKINDIIRMGQTIFKISTNTLTIDEKKAIGASYKGQSDKLTLPNLSQITKKNL